MEILKYRIQKREMSPNVIEKNISIDPNKPKWVIYICPIGNRHNNIAHEIIKTLK